MLSFNFGSSCKFFILTSSPSFLYLPTSVGHTHEWKTVFVAVCGSSPHTWGIPLLGLRMLLPDRFIPTHVGHTQDRAGMSTPRSVHPHIRGAYACYVPTIVYHIGSSPHTWGILPRECNTPRTHSVHPHIRGAYTREDEAREFMRGSSPHTWGIPLQAVSADYR